LSPAFLAGPLATTTFIQQNDFRTVLVLLRPFDFFCLRREKVSPPWLIDQSKGLFLNECPRPGLLRASKWFRRAYAIIPPHEQELAPSLHAALWKGLNKFPRVIRATPAAFLEYLVPAVEESFLLSPT